MLTHVRWSLKFGASLELGIWSLELPQIEQFKKSAAL
jgi:hypothetical protein